MTHLVPPNKDEDQDKKGSVLMRGLANFFKQEIDKEYLNYKKVTSLKMLFFDCLPKKYSSKFDNTRFFSRTE